MGTVRQPISRLPLVTELGSDALFPFLENPDSEDKRTVAISYENMLGSTVEQILFSLAIRIALYAQGSLSGVLLRIQLPEPFIIPASFPSSIASSGVAAAAETELTVNKNGVEIGTITFDAAATEGVFAGAGETFDPEDVLTVEGPAVADAALDELAITIAGGRI